jgi:hypothetical protein
MLFGMPSTAMLQTPLSHWVNVPPTWDTLLLNPHKKQKGALKRRAADVKIGPLMHVEGMHNDGGPVAMTAQVIGCFGWIQTQQRWCRTGMVAC